MFSLLVWRFLYFFRIIYCLCAVFLSVLIFVFFLCCLSVVFYVCFRGTFFHDVLYKPVRKSYGSGVEDNFHPR